MKKLKFIHVFFTLLILGNIIYAVHFSQLMKKQESITMDPLSIPVSCHLTEEFEYRRAINKDVKLAEGAGTLENGLAVVEIWQIKPNDGVVLVFKRGDVTCTAMRIYRMGTPT